MNDNAIRLQQLQESARENQMDRVAPGDSSSEALASTRLST